MVKVAYRDFCVSIGIREILEIGWKVFTIYLFREEFLRRAWVDESPDHGLCNTYGFSIHIML